MSFGGGGGGGSGTQQYNWNENMAPRWQDMLDLGNSLRQRPYEPYQGQLSPQQPNSGFGTQYAGQRIASMSPDQLTAFDELRNMNYGTANPLPTINAAMGQTQHTLNGEYLTGDKSNPYSTLNPMTANGNPYMGNSPQFQGLLRSGMDDITNAYNKGTAADTTRMFNLAGAFGGSAHQDAMANNEAALGKTLSNYASGMQNDQYNRSANIAEQELGRGDNMYESYLNRGSQNYENERQRQMGAIGLGNQQQELGFQRANALLGVGDSYRGFNQDLLNQNYNDWQAGQNNEFNMADWYTGLLSRAQGGMSPNMTSTQAGYSASPFSQLLGGGMLASSLFGR